MLEAPDAPPGAPELAAETRQRRRWPMLLALMAFGVGATAVLAVGFGRDPSIVPSELIDEPAPPLAGPTLGGQFDLRDHTGEVVVVNVWASWCTVCREEHAELEAAAAQLQPAGVQFVGINTQDTVDDAKQFLEEMGGSSYPSVLDPRGRKAVEWGVFGVPETFLIDQRGRIRAKIVGKVTREWLVSGARLLLGPATS